jgi:hypothetical protein
MGQYDQNQYVDEHGNPVSPEMYQQMLHQQQQQDYGNEMGAEYGDEMMHGDQQYMQQQ